MARALSGRVHITSSALERERLTSLQEFQEQEESDRTHSRMPTKRIPATVRLTVFDLIVDKSLLCVSKDIQHPTNNKGRVAPRGLTGRILKIRERHIYD